VVVALADDHGSPQKADKQSVPDTITGTMANVEIAGNSAETAQLTNREQEIARLLGGDAGLTNRQLAGQLYVTVRTIEAHVNHIMCKLGISSRAQIVVWAMTHSPKVR
jgi:non-specific serine/threonine protein kinase